MKNLGTFVKYLHTVGQSQCQGYVHTKAHSDIPTVTCPSAMLLKSPLHYINLRPYARHVNASCLIERCVYINGRGQKAFDKVCHSCICWRYADMSSA